MTGQVGDSAYKNAWEQARRQPQIPEWAADVSYFGSDDSKNKWFASMRGERGMIGRETTIIGEKGDSTYDIAYAAELAKDSAYRASWFNLTDKDAGKANWLTSLTGQVGKSAYNIAYEVEEAKDADARASWFDGDEADWLTSLTGKVGEDGEDGDDGEDANSAYNIAYEVERAKAETDRAYWFDSADKDGSKDEWVTSLTGQAGENLEIPIGTVIAYHGSQAPSGWRLCDGNGEVTINGQQVDIPDLRGRFILGAEQTDAQLGSRGGYEQHKLTESEMPRHRHGYEDRNLGGRRGGVCGGRQKTNLSVIKESEETGGSEPHNNMPPYYVLTYIIYVGDS
jgi:microcystin-dependent protein